MSQHFKFPRDYKFLFGVVTRSVYQGKCTQFEYNDAPEYVDGGVLQQPKCESVVDYDSVTFVDTDDTERLQRHVPHTPNTMTLVVEGDVLYQQKTSYIQSYDNYTVHLNGRSWHSFDTEKFTNHLAAKSKTPIFIGNYTTKMNPAHAQESLPRAKRELMKKIVGVDDGTTVTVKSSIPGTRICVLLHHDRVVSWWKTSVPFYYFFSTLFTLQLREHRDVNYTSLMCSAKLGIKSLHNYEANAPKLEESSMYKRHSYIRACVDTFLAQMGAFIKEHAFPDNGFMAELTESCEHLTSITALNTIAAKYKIKNSFMNMQHIVDLILEENTSWAIESELENRAEISCFRDLFDLTDYTLNNFFRINYEGEAVQFKTCQILFHIKDYDLNTPEAMFFYTNALKALGYIQPQYSYLGQQLVSSAN
jgi:hypothetical protein